MGALCIATWNIGGGLVTSPTTSANCAGLNLGYIAAKLQNIGADVICMQECTTSPDGRYSSAHEIAQYLRMPYVLNLPCNPSHIHEGQRESLSILSRSPVGQATTIRLPRREVEGQVKDARITEIYDRYLQIVRLKGINIANTHLDPLHHFALSYDTEPGSTLALAIDRELARIEGPHVLCGDFNFNDPLSVFQSMRERGIREALPREVTHPHKLSARLYFDHILYSSHMDVLEAHVERTSTDHYLCWAKFAENKDSR